MEFVGQALDIQRGMHLNRTRVAGTGCDMILEQVGQAWTPTARFLVCHGCSF